ncbi:hypothetical protein NEOLEDRAFT_1183591 [Neolentinus lepideus HHB14362 ss-1]|uniref:Uncharacterized protein n=1 Tax=Neolentinus lepideus HHB14362 ss-1 TaxID=1314782 RepID=A0A165N5V7_9AGAM|nr:hypothetical protein NEOLEDRAFT_1183591 [Neolentinus lepideus HHB14362 ss-1]
MGDIYDPFEPALVKPALEHSELNLGHLIFGEEKWISLGGSTPSEPDPLTKIYKSQVFFLAQKMKTLLKSDHYTELFMEAPRQCHRDLRLFKMPKAVFTPLQPFPENSVAFRGDQLSTNSAKCDELLGKDKKSWLFQDVVNRNTTDVAVGPLEYCGHALVVNTPHGDHLISTCRVDPALPDNLRKCELLTLIRVRNKAEQPGKRHEAMTARMKQKAVNEVQKALSVAPVSTKKSVFTAKALNMAILGGPKFKPLYRNMNTFDEDWNKFNNINKVSIWKQIHTEYKVPFWYVYNSLPHSIHISPYHHPKKAYIQTDDPDLPVFYYDPLINPISLRDSTPKNALLISHEDAIYGPNEEVEPFFEDRPLEINLTTDAIALWWAPALYNWQSGCMQHVQDIPLVKNRYLEHSYKDMAHTNH